MNIIDGVGWERARKLGRETELDMVELEMNEGED